MSVIVIEGDLLEADCDIIAHGCNCFHTFGSGIARQIKKKYPKAFRVDKGSSYASKAKLGTFTMAAGDPTIYNLYTQFRYGRNQRYLDYEALFKSLQAMKNDIDSMGWDKPKIGFPKIGCGLGGGDWRIVSAMIETVFDDRDVYVYYMP
jgi:O-acetyl-ADP-ribose deacetylase (regulator of RNase III)